MFRRFCSQGLATKLFFGVFLSFLACRSQFAIATPNAESLSTRIEKARESVLKGERMTAVKSFRELAKETSGAASTKNARDVMQAWREVAELFLTDKGQNQASLAESFWMTRPKESVDILLPLLKQEDGNFVVAKLGARAALRTLDCAKAETFTASAEQVFPNGLETKLLRLQVQDCLNGGNAAALPLKLPTLGSGGRTTDSEMTELEPAFRMLAVRDAYRRKDLVAAKSALGFWDALATNAAQEDPEYWYWKWRLSPEVSRDRTSGRNYLSLCSKLTARRRKKFAMHPELCAFTESVESELKSSEKSRL